MITSAQSAMLRPSTQILAIILVAVLGSAVWFYTYQLNILVPLEGFSPIDWVNRLTEPDNFARNFPNGVENFSSSAFMYIYPLCQQLFGISPEHLLPFVIGIEIAAYSASIAFLCRLLFPSMPLAVVLAVIPIMVASSARDISLARYGEPFFIGQFYNIADSLRIAGITFLLASRPFLSCVSLSLSFMTHPLMGLMGIVFAVATTIPRVKNALNRKYAAAALVLLAVVSLWTVFVVGVTSSTTASVSFPSDVWYHYTELFNWHWYPFRVGFFDVLHTERFLPFLCFLSVMFVLNPIIRKQRSDEELKVDKKMLIGMVTMALLTCVGWLFSVWHVSPLLTKLCLHRAADLIVTFGWLYIVFGVWLVLINEQCGTLAWIRKILAASLLVCPFIFNVAFVYLIVALFVCFEIGTTIASREKFGISRKLACIVLLLTLFCFGYWSSIGVLEPIAVPAYTGGLKVLVIAFITAVIVAAMHFAKGLKNGEKLSQIVLLLSVSLCSGYWMWWHTNSLVAKVFLSTPYKQAQLWARQNTAKDAAFLIDPTIYYGWRDFSHRSSFGSAREWLMSGWAYNSSYPIFQEGLRRFELFGLNIEPYSESRYSSIASGEFNEDLTNKFYGMTSNQLLKITQDNKLDYVVLSTDKVKQTYEMPVVFKNEKYMILKATGKMGQND